MNKKEIEETVEQLVMDIISESADNAGDFNKDKKIEIVDVEYVKERNWYLRVFLDKENGIELDDCQWISERLGERIDRLDLIKDQYYLEVSSPGIDRQLKKERDFVRHSGDMVEVKLYQPMNGTKNFVGRLLGLKDGVIHIKDAVDVNNITDKKGKKEVAQTVQIEELDIPWDKAASVRLYIEF